jgi:ATP-binding cassette subfamily F protein 3
LHGNLTLFHHFFSPSKGKSTMLRAIAARRVGDVPANVTVHYVSQEVVLTEDQRGKTPVEIVVDADIERNLLSEELIDLEKRASSGDLDVEGSKRHGEVLSRLDEIEADSAPRRAKELLDNLGFSDALQSRSLSQLSGGWRVRTMLAAAIFAKPDLLLLDEPTNHLSILAVMWLARELSTSETWKERIVVIVSHDRHFMDEVCSDCLHVSGVARKLTQSRGNYSVWAKRRKDEQVLFAKEQAKRQEEIDKLREYAGHGFKYGGSSSQINKMGQKTKQADKLEEIHAEHAIELAALQEDIELPMKIAAGGELNGFVVQLKGVGFGYPGAKPERLFRHCEFGITSKSRIVLLGENGNGKTTLVKLIMGELQPSDGDVLRSPHARFAVVNQHHADQIDLSLTPLEFLKSQFPGDGSYEHMQKLRSHLSSCGVTSGSSNNASGASKVFDLQNTPAKGLSGGQRSRVALAAVSFAQPHVLVLDEPTNNLDLESVAALAECVKNFEGAVICVSHDQYFVTAVANEAWVVSGGIVKQVESFDSYRAAQYKVLSKGKQKGN